MIDDHETPPTSAAPPTDPMDFELEPELPKWPKVVGITSIVLAGIGLGCGGCGIAMLLGGTEFFLKMAEQQMGPAPSVMLPTLQQKVQGSIGFLWAVLLLIAGIQTLRRQYSGRLLHLAYGIGTIPLFIWGMKIQFDAMAAINQWAQANPDNLWAQQQNPIGQWIGLGIAVLLSLPWPLFCLGWFGLVKKKPEDFTGGLMVDQL
ncbi:MAG: hypothetical protein R3B46_04495 [Phycisphaerales bacterium]